MSDGAFDEARFARLREELLLARCVITSMPISATRRTRWRTR